MDGGLIIESISCSVVGEGNCKPLQALSSAGDVITTSCAMDGEQSV